MLNLIKNWLNAKPQDAPLNELERLFGLAMKDPSVREAFYLAFLNTELYVSGSFSGPGQADLLFYDVAGEKVLPVFSHPSRLEKVLGDSAPVLKFKGFDLLQSVAPGKPLALNPYSDMGREFSAAELAEILQRAD